MDTKKQKISYLILGIVSIIMFIITVDKLSPMLPGVAGKLYQHNAREKIETTALFYSESGDIRNYLDPRKGKYR